MKSFVKSLGCALLCVAIVNIEAAPATAQPAASPVRAIADQARLTNNVEQVQFRNGRRFRSYGNRRGNGGNIALGIGAAIIGGIVLSEAARAEHRNAHGSDWDRCARTYRSFESNTGMYTGYDGVRRTCPYLH